MTARRDILKAISIVALSSTAPALAHPSPTVQCKRMRTPEEMADDLSESLAARYGGDWAVCFDGQGKFVLFKQV